MTRLDRAVTRIEAAARSVTGPLERVTSSLDPKALREIPETLDALRRETLPALRAATETQNRIAGLQSTLDRIVGVIADLPGAGVLRRATRPAPPDRDARRAPAGVPRAAEHGRATIRSSELVCETIACYERGDGGSRSGRRRAQRAEAAGAVAEVRPAPRLGALADGGRRRQRLRLLRGATQCRRPAGRAGPASAAHTASGSSTGSVVRRRLDPGNYSVVTPYLSSRVGTDPGRRARRPLRHAPAYRAVRGTAHPPPAPWVATSAAGATSGAAGSVPARLRGRRRRGDRAARRGSGCAFGGIALSSLSSPVSGAFLVLAARAAFLVDASTGA